MHARPIRFYRASDTFVVTQNTPANIATSLPRDVNITVNLEFRGGNLGKHAVIMQSLNYTLT